jgi:hypothetical protein
VEQDSYSMLDQASVDFARQTTLRMLKVLASMPEGAKLIVIGEPHEDFTDIPQRHPASHALYTEIAALEAAIHHAGKKNVVLSLEVPNQLLKEIKQQIQDNSGKISPDAHQTLHLIQYAMQHNISMVGSDPNGAAAHYTPIDSVASVG